MIIIEFSEPEKHGYDTAVLFGVSEATPTCRHDDPACGYILQCTDSQMISFDDRRHVLATFANLNEFVHQGTVIATFQLLNLNYYFNKQSVRGPKVLHLEALRGSKPVGQEQWNQDQA